MYCWRDGQFEDAENLAKAYNCDIDNLFEEVFPNLFPANWEENCLGVREGEQSPHH